MFVQGKNLDDNIDSGDDVLLYSIVEGEYVSLEGVTIRSRGLGTPNPTPSASVYDNNPAVVMTIGLP